MTDVEIDWGPQDGDPLSTCFCRCDAIFGSHTKFVWIEGRGVTVTRRACPSCGRNDDCYQIEGPTHHMEI